MPGVDRQRPAERVVASARRPRNGARVHRGAGRVRDRDASARRRRYGPARWGTRRGRETPARWSTPSGAVSARRSRSSRPTFAAIDASALNAFCYEPDASDARSPPARADVSLPFGGVPIGRQGARPRRRLAGHRRVASCSPTTSPPSPRRIVAARPSTTAVPCWSARRRPASSAASTSPAPCSTAPRATRGSSTRTPGGSSGGIGGGRRRRAASRWPPAATAAARSASPPASRGLVGLKATFGRIPRGPHARDRQPTRSTDRRAWPARCATRPAGSTSPTATTPGIPSACRASRAGRPGSARSPTSSAGCAWPSSPTGAAPSSRPRCGSCSRRQPTT